MSERLNKIFGRKQTDFVRRIIRLALDEDGQDLTSNGIFDSHDMAYGNLSPVRTPLLSVWF